MPSVGPYTAGTVANDASVGTDAWTGTGNTAVSDNSRATFTDSSNGSQYLKCTNFNGGSFNLPDPALVVGVTVTGEVSASDSSSSGSGRRINEQFVRLVVGGVIMGNNYAKTATADRWPLVASEATRTWGGPTDKWGIPGLNASHVNSSGFGVAISAAGNRQDNTEVGNIDFLSITVDYLPSIFATSIQTQTVTIGASATSGTAGLFPNVTTSRAIIFPGGSRTTAASITSPAQGFARLTLTDAATLTGNRETSNAGTFLLPCTVVDATTALVVSVQYGTITISNGNQQGTATLGTTVGTLGNATVHYMGHTTDITTSNASNHWAEIDLTNTTTVTATRNGTTGAITVGYCVVEWQSSVIQSIQKRNPTFNSSSNTDNDTITAVNMANTILLFGGVTSSGSTNSGCMESLQLTSTTNVAARRESTATGNHTVRYTVLEFKPGVLASVQRDTDTYTGATTTTSTISAVVVANAVCLQTGKHSNTSSFGQIQTTAELTNTTTVTTTAGQSLAANGGDAFEVFEFANTPPPVAPAMQGLHNQFTAFYEGTTDPTMHKISDGISAMNDNDETRMAA